MAATTMSSLPRKRQYQLEEVIKGCPVIRGDDALVQAFLEAVATTNGRQCEEPTTLLFLWHWEALTRFLQKLALILVTCSTFGSPLLPHPPSFQRLVKAVETGGIVPGGSVVNSGRGHDMPANAAGSVESSESNDKFVLEDLLAECILAHITTLVPDGVAVRILHERAGFTWSRSQLSLSAMCAIIASLYWCDPWLAAVLSVGTGKNGKSGGTSCLQGGAEGPLALLLLPRCPYPRHGGTSALATSTICDALPLSGKLWS